MRNRFKALLFIALLGIVQACQKKEIPVSYEGTPVFMMESNINGNEVNITAGKNNYYMFTGTSVDAMGVLVMNGQLRPEDCSKCNHEFSFYYRDSKLRNTITINNIEEVLKTGNYNYFNGRDTLNNLSGAHISFNAYAPAGTNYTYSWDFGDGTGSNLANPTHQYAEPADYNVCLTVSNGGISKTICNVIPMDSLCRFQFTQTMSQNYVSFYVLGNGNSYAWNFGSPAAWAYSGLTTSYTFPQAGIYRVVLKDSLSGNNCDNTFSKDIMVGNYTGSDIAAGFNYALINNGNNTIPVDTGFSKVVINYSSPDGKQYSTYNAYAHHQQNNNYFNVTKVEPFEKNSAGQRTYKMEGSFKAWFYNTQNLNDSIFINTTKFVVGVAAP